MAILIRWLHLCLFLTFLSPQLAFGQTQLPGDSLVKVAMKLQQHHGDLFLLLALENEIGHHTYWQNPGESGLPLEFQFWLNDQVVELPLFAMSRPERTIERGDIVTYGHQGRYLYAFKLPPQVTNALTPALLRVEIGWLICKESCLPGHFRQTKRVLGAQLLSENSVPEELELATAEWQSLWEALPRPQPRNWPPGLEVILFQKSAQELLLMATLPAAMAPPRDFLLLPYPDNFKQLGWQFQRERWFVDRNHTLYAFTSIRPTNRSLPNQGPWPLNFLHEGLLLQKSFASPLRPWSAEMEEFFKNLTPWSPQAPLSLDSSGPPRSAPSIFLMVLFALLGGFILNFMPCVLPVISLKLFSLLQLQAHSLQERRAQTLAYCSGIFMSLGTLAALTVVLQKSAQFVGWGMQMHSPFFVLTLALITFLMALNWFGLFELSWPLIGRIANFKFSGRKAEVANGVLATLLAIPCSAPLLATATGFALTQSPLVILLIFSAIALGLASPFLILLFWPQLLGRLPRPGQWMVRLKWVMASILLVTAVWLGGIGVGQLQADTDDATELMRKTNAQQNAVVWSPWSSQAMQESMSRQENLMILFTADWCITCKANERLILAGHKFSALTKRHQMTLLKGDWTHQDPTITAFLQQHQISGVPAYFLWRPGQTELTSLGIYPSLKEIDHYFTR